MVDVVSEYGPIDPWWTLEQLSLGDWLPTMQDKKWYSEADALAEATKQARIQNSSHRVVAKDGTTSVPGPQVDPPTSWYEVESEGEPDAWTGVENPEQAGSYKFWSLVDAEAVAQTKARELQARTRVVSKGA